MRIAVSGSHATGKSTLIAELARRLDGYDVVEEPYHALEGEGQVFGYPPSADDFELLFRRALVTLRAPGTSRGLFDRSPADYLAYWRVLDPTSNLSDSIADAAAALATLDLLVFVPIEVPDRIHGSEAPRLRRRVDRVLHEMFVDRSWGFDIPVVIVQGAPSERVAQVIARLPASERTGRDRRVS